MPKANSPQPFQGSGAGPSNAFALENYTQIDEPSPLDRILAEGRSYNGGNWSSEELKNLFDGLHKYGTGKSATTYICRNLVRSRSTEEVKAKIDEIRDIIKESKETVIMEFYRKKWIDAGHRNIVPPVDSEVNPNEDWSSVITKVLDHHHPAINKHTNPMREILEKVLDDFATESTTQQNAPVTAMKTARATNTSTQDVRWPVIYQFMKACAMLEGQMPAINELEAAIISKVLDTIEDEAATIPEAEKAVLSGIFTECQLNDFRFCEQDHPNSIESALQLYIDPLRTRMHGIPEVAAEVELNDDNNLPSTSS
uniref:Uncharacterized protein n=1 Tax=Caenorhabditis japonica TaxID=281687 RepID=A0A8R1DSN4_CAEJA